MDCPAGAKTKSEFTVKVCGYTSMIFYHFTKGNNFSDFLFALPAGEALPKRGLLFKID